MHTGHETLEIMRKATWYNSWLLRQIAPYLRGDILEVGAGIGNFTKQLEKYGEVIAIDYDCSYRNANFGDIEKGEYFFSPKVGAKHHNKKFNAIVCMNVLEHIKNDNQALENMYKLLKKGGKLVLLVPAFNFAFGPMDKALGHYRRYTKKTISDLLVVNKYSLVVSRYLNFLGLLGWFINGRVLGKKLIPEGQLGIFDKLARPFLRFEEFVHSPAGLSVLVVGKKTHA